MYVGKYYIMRCLCFELHTMTKLLNSVNRKLKICNAAVRRRAFKIKNIL